MKQVYFLLFATIVLGNPLIAQLQVCPANVNFAQGDLSFWSASTGLVGRSQQTYPAPNAGIQTLPEYGLSRTGIEVITNNGLDLYGSFPTVPTINGYSYRYSVKLGSDATSYDLQNNNRNPGGFTRSVSYTINVPAGSSAIPYTMTYAYAMVLENGTHVSDEQPLFKATLSTKDSVITCASPKYYLPTFGNVNNNGSGATLDTATAIKNGFSNSRVPFLSHTGNNPAGVLLYDVWTKDWTEVTFDLSPYRGQQVVLSFEADNCTPGAHFAYSYVALRDVCAGLEISGDRSTCEGNELTYSVPSLANGAYDWQVPAGWTVTSGEGSNIITVMAGANGGSVIAHELNGCANLWDTIFVSSRPASKGGLLNSNIVCTGQNTTTLDVQNKTGDIVNWLYSTDGTSWKSLNTSVASYIATNITAVTSYRAIVQNGIGCKPDTSSTGTIKVDARSKGGTLSPGASYFCTGEDVKSTLTLSGNTGAVINWLSSIDSSSWKGIAPATSGNSYNVKGIVQTTYYRTLVKNGVCPADTSSVAALYYLANLYPQARVSNDTVICYGASTELQATITTGTSYSWTPMAGLSNAGNGVVPSLPYSLLTTASPLQTTCYILTVKNEGCPNLLRDTVMINVRPKLTVFAGKDTAIVEEQPVPLNAVTSDSTISKYLWTPATGLSSTTIKNPVAVLGGEAGAFVTYEVTATDDIGCSAHDDITIKVFKTGADIFVPNAFTPNSDGRNDVIKPIYVGIRQLNFFRMYNRWGQLVFSTNVMDEGWDGRVKGKDEPTANFVFMVQGVDYTGRVVFKKGNIVLVR
jgi:gliding motility-associated-like protein